MRNEILKIINDHPKSYVKIIRKNQLLIDWVKQESLCQTERLPEMIYSALHKVSNICENGNIKKFDRISTGFIGCGPANVCTCTKYKISAHVKDTKSLITSNEQAKINAKRKESMLKKYGVETNSQRPEIKLKLSKPKIHKEALDKLTNFDWLNEQYNIKGRTLLDIADELNVYYSTVGEYCVKFGFQIRQTTNYSLVEEQIANFLRDHNIKVIQHDWSVLNNCEIDLFLPEVNIGIEVNGLYWHSWSPATNKIEDKFRHLNKSTSALKKGIEIIHITDFEWYNKNDLVKNYLLSKIGKNARIYARKCIIKPVDNITERNFLKQYHLQGYIKSESAFGLYYGNELVMLLTVGRSRFNNSNSTVEILRVVSKAGVTVVGGLSKLVRHVSSIYRCDLITYCDFDKSVGNGYTQIGMIKVQDPSPGYFWTDGNVVISRYRAQKKNLQKWLLGYDSSLSEAENMFNTNFRRYWTCGNIKFVYQWHD